MIRVFTLLFSPSFFSLPPKKNPIPHPADGSRALAHLFPRAVPGEDVELGELGGVFLGLQPQGGDAGRPPVGGGTGRVPQPRRAHRALGGRRRLPQQRRGAGGAAQGGHGGKEPAREAQTAVTAAPGSAGPARLLPTKRGREGTQTRWKYPTAGRQKIFFGGKKIFKGRKKSLSLVVPDFHSRRQWAVAGVCAGEAPGPGQGGLAPPVPRTRPGLREQRCGSRPALPAPRPRLPRELVPTRTCGSCSAPLMPAAKNPSVTVPPRPERLAARGMSRLLFIPTGQIPATPARSKAEATGARRKTHGRVWFVRGSTAFRGPVPRGPCPSPAVPTGNPRPPGGRAGEQPSPNERPRRKHVTRAAPNQRRLRGAPSSNGGAAARGGSRVGPRSARRPRLRTARCRCTGRGRAVPAEGGADEGGVAEHGRAQEGAEAERGPAGGQRRGAGGRRRQAGEGGGRGGGGGPGGV